jgi:hypothetical protein
MVEGDNQATIVTETGDKEIRRTASLPDRGDVKIERDHQLQKCRGQKAKDQSRTCRARFRRIQIFRSAIDEPHQINVALKKLIIR